MPNVMLILNAIGYILTTLNEFKVIVARLDSNGGIHEVLFLDSPDIAGDILDLRLFEVEEQFSYEDVKDKTDELRTKLQKKGVV